MFPDGFSLRPFVEFFLLIVYTTFMVWYSPLTMGYVLLLFIVWIYDFAKKYDHISSEIRKLK
jgi:hypothetical protein